MCAGSPCWSLRGSLEYRITWCALAHLAGASEVHCEYRITWCALAHLAGASEVHCEYRIKWCALAHLAGASEVHCEYQITWCALAHLAGASEVHSEYRITWCALAHLAGASEVHCEYRITWCALAHLAGASEVHCEYRITWCALAHLVGASEVHLSTGSRGVRWLTLLEPPRFTVNRSVPPSSAIWRCSRESRVAVAHSRQSLCVVRNRSVTSSTSEREPGASSTRTYWLPLKLRVTAAETTATLAS